MGTSKSKVPAPVELITPRALYNMQADLRSNHCVLDVRGRKHYDVSHCDLSACAASGPIEFPDPFDPTFTRAPVTRPFDLAIVYGADEDATCAEVFSRLNRRYARALRLARLIDYNAFAELYPYLMTGHALYVEGRLFPSQIDDRVFLSNYGVASNPAVVQLLGITHVINCTVDCPFVVLRECDPAVQLALLRIPVIDESDQQIGSYFRMASEFLAAALADHASRVLIHCKHGQSRSATVAAAFLIACRGHTTDTALALLKASRPKVSPNAGFVAQLRHFEQDALKA
jgi:hypothetical protein